MPVFPLQSEHHSAALEAGADIVRGEDVFPEVNELLLYTVLTIIQSTVSASRI